MDGLSNGGRLGSYVLGKRIAVGGMAEIWSATDASGARCALKVLLPELARDQRLRLMFLDEVRIVTRLKHPNIVEVRGGYEDGAWLFFAMELIEGRDLRQILERIARAGEQVPIVVAVQIAAAAARALSHAHTARSASGTPLDIVHRDVSPHNVMVTRDGAVKVLDFGVARAKARMTRTRQGVIKGKLAYMAPEQLLAQPLDARCDVFALGVVLWELLAVRRLFGGQDDAQVVAAICEGRAPAVDTINPDVPSPLSMLVSSMLSVRTCDRPGSMRTVEGALTKVLHLLETPRSARARLTEWAAQAVPAVRKATAVLPVPDDGSGSIATSETSSLHRDVSLVDGIATEALEVGAGLIAADGPAEGETLPRLSSAVVRAVRAELDGDDPPT